MKSGNNFAPHLYISTISSFRHFGSRYFVISCFKHALLANKTPLLPVWKLTVFNLVNVLRVIHTCIIYSRLNASVILERKETLLERNETRLERNETRLERNDTHLARNETRSGNLHLMTDYYGAFSTSTSNFSGQIQSATIDTSYKSILTCLYNNKKI